MPINRRKKIGVSQKAVIIGNDGKILAIRRSDTHPFRPLGWDVPGGDLEFGEDAKKGIRREIKEETGLSVGDLKVADVFSVSNGRGEFWVTVCYSAIALTGKVKLSWEHDDFRWVTPKEFQKLDAGAKIKKFVKDLFSSTKK